MTRFLFSFSVGWAPLLFWNVLWSEPQVDEPVHPLETSIVLEWELYPFFEITGLSNTLGRVAVQDFVLKADWPLPDFVDALVDREPAPLGINLQAPVVFHLSVPQGPEALEKAGFTLFLSLGDAAKWASAVEQFQKLKSGEGIVFEAVEEGAYRGFSLELSPEAQPPLSAPFETRLLWNEDTVVMQVGRSGSVPPAVLPWMEPLRPLTEDGSVFRMFFNPDALTTGTGFAQIDEILEVFYQNPDMRMLLQGPPSAISLNLAADRVNVITRSLLPAESKVLQLYEASLPEGWSASNPRPLLDFGFAFQMEAVESIVEDMLGTLTRSHETDFSADERIPGVELSLREILEGLRGDLRLGLSFLEFTEDLKSGGLEAFLQLGLRDSTTLGAFFSSYAQLINTLGFGRAELSFEADQMDLRYSFREEPEDGASLTKLEGRPWNAESRARLSGSQSYAWLDLAAFHPLFSALTSAEFLNDEALPQLWLGWLQTLNRIESSNRLTNDPILVSTFDLIGQAAARPFVPAFWLNLEATADPMLLNPFELVGLEQQRLAFLADRNGFRERLAGTWLIWEEALEGLDPSEEAFDVYLEIRDTSGRYELFEILEEGDGSFTRELIEKGRWNTNGWTIRYYPEPSEDYLEDDFEPFAEGLRWVQLDRIGSYTLDLGTPMTFIQNRVGDSDEAIQFALQQGPQ